MNRAAAILLLIMTIAAMAAGQGNGREFIVTLKDGEAIEAFNSRHQTATVRQIPGTSAFLVRESVSDSKTIERLQKDNNVESVEENIPIRLNDSFTIDLADAGDRTILNGSEVPMAYANQAALSIVEGDNGRALSTGAGTRVAFIDTGVDFSHPALRPWLDPGVDLIAGRSASELDGVDLSDSTETIFLLDTGEPAAGSTLPPALGHGTLVAGIIHLVAPDAVLVPIKAFDPHGNTTLFTIIEAVHRAVDLNVDVVNMSFTMSTDSKALRTAINRAAALGITFVSSVGNEGMDVGAVYPASYSGVVGVAATDFSDQLADFSNYGRSVSISAPGMAIVSTALGGRYAAAWGTSFSAPFVSGAAAVMASLRPRGASEAPLILSTTDPVAGSGNGINAIAGRGRLNIRKALEGVTRGY